MNSNNNILVKLNNAGFRQNNKWLVEGVSLKVEKGKIVMIIGSFFKFFINTLLIGCYNITLCNNITFASQGLNEF